MLVTLAAIGIAIAHLGAIAVIVVAVLTMDVLIEWFRDRLAQVLGNPKKLNVTVTDALESGNVSYIQGIFDTEEEAFTEARRIKAGEVDDDVRQAHSRHPVAIWT
jgi:hypothetical protein